MVWKWIEKNLGFTLIRPDLAGEVAKIILEELSKNHVLVQCSGPGLPVWALTPGYVLAPGGTDGLQPLPRGACS